MKLLVPRSSMSASHRLPDSHLLAPSPSCTPFFHAVMTWTEPPPCSVADAMPAQKRRTADAKPPPPDEHPSRTRPKIDG